MARRKRIPYDPPGSRGKNRKRHRSLLRTEQLFMTRRMLLARGAIAAAFATLAGRLGFMQLVEHENYQELAQRNIQSYVRIPPTRGMILDRKQRELARNERAWEVRINPANLPDLASPQRAEVLAHVVNALNLPEALILDPDGIPEGEEAIVYAKTAQLLGKATLGVEETGQTAVQDGVLTPSADVLMVNGRELRVFVYPSAAECAAEAGRLSADGGQLLGPDGTEIEDTPVDWGGPCSLIAAGNTLSAFLCEDLSLISSVKRALDRLDVSRLLTVSDVASELRRAGLASWTEYIEAEKRFNRLVRLEDELTTDQAALARSRLHELPGVSVVNQLEYRIANAPSGQKVVAQTGVSRDVALKLEANAFSLPGVEVDGDVLVRAYPGGESMSHILGFAGKISEAEREDPANLNEAGNRLYDLDDTIGKDGLERVVERTLRGQPGGRWVVRDAQMVEREVIKQTPPSPGDNVRLTIDLEFQRAVAEILRLGIEFSNADRNAIAARDPSKAIKKESGAGSVVAIDPRNGEVLAMVSYPHYDNQLFVDGISSRKFREYTSKERNEPLLDRALRGRYPPGSTLKPFLAAVGLHEQTLTPDTTYRCTGAIHVPYQWDESKGNKHPCWTLDDRHGELDVRTAIARSCDVFFYNVGAPRQPIDENNPNSDYLHYRDFLPGPEEYGEKHYFEGLGIERIKTNLETQFAFGQETGIELPTEERGIVPNNAWKLEYEGNGWSVGDTIITSIGQGYFLTTPLQLALNTAVIANGGTMYRPRLVAETFDSARSRVVTTEVEVRRKATIQSEHFQIVREGMRQMIGALEEVAQAANERTKWPKSNPPDDPNQPEIELAGKTGTAEIGTADEFGKYDRTHAWFTCFAPYNDPEIALAVLVEDGGEGSLYAVPVADRVLRAYFELTGKRPRGLVLRSDGERAGPLDPVLADGAAFPTPGGVTVEAVD